MIRAGSQTAPAARARPRTPTASTVSSASTARGAAGRRGRDVPATRRGPTRWASRIAGSADWTRDGSTTADPSRARAVTGGVAARRTRSGCMGTTLGRMSGRVFDVLPSNREATAVGRLASDRVRARRVSTRRAAADAGRGARTARGATTPASTAGTVAAAGCGLAVTDGRLCTPAGSPPVPADWAWSWGSGSLAAGALTATSTRSAGTSARGAWTGCGSGSGSGVGLRAGKRPRGST